MNNFLKTKSKYFFIILILLLNFCQTNLPTAKLETIPFPPESDKVLENGSRPAGFFDVLKEAKIDPNCLDCNSQNRYSKQLKPFSKVSAKILLDKITPFIKKDLNKADDEELFEKLEDHVMWAMVRGVLIEGNNNNLGAIVLKGYYWTDKNGKEQPLTIFRSAFTPFPKDKNSCFRSLLEKGKVKHVINLYDGDMNLNDLIKEEKETSEELGASYVRTADLNYGHWRGTIRKHPKKGPELTRATNNVARLIKEQIFNPQGKAPKGNILIHCGGGMHRTGMIVGLLMRLINKSSEKLIIDTYKYHTGYRSKDTQGGFEQGNLDFIFNFNPKLLQ